MSNTPTPWLASAVDAAAATVQHAARRGGGVLGPMGVGDLAALGGALTDLLERLVTWTGRSAPGVAVLVEDYELRDDSGTVNLGARCLQAADHLTQVAAHLRAATAAAREFHTAVDPPRAA